MAEDAQGFLSPVWSSADTVAWPFIRLMVDCSVLAYDPEPVGLGKLRSLGLTGELLSGRGVDAFPMTVSVIRAGSDAILAFRGTQSGGSILQDLKVIRRRTPEGRLHAGFADGYTDIHDSVVSRLRRCCAKRVWLTGHSLGGALAVVGANRLEEAGFDVAGVVTFGQPMVAMPDLARLLARRFRGRYVAFVNGSDPVPRAVLPYVHFGRCVRLAGDVFTRFDRVPRTFGMAASGGARADGELDVDDTELAPMDADELAALIEQIEADEASPRLDAQGRNIARGLFNPFQGHSLAAYADLVDRFLAAGQA
ncbi:MAG: lipase family protein [Planctomycetia bacterium]